MQKIAKFSLFLVVLVDVMGQGLGFPIFNTLLMDQGTGFLPPDTPTAQRHLLYGLLIAVFFLSWFLGSVYISRISDSLGRRTGLLLCLSGVLAGYVLTVLALLWDSYLLLILSRVVTGFMSGNQPIAQAAMVDMAKNDADRTRNLAYVVSGVYFGLVVGPIIGGALSDTALLPGLASLALPFYVGTALVILTLGMVAFFFKDPMQERVPLRLHPMEIFKLLWDITKQPTVMRILPSYALFMFTGNTFFIFMDNYLTAEFKIMTTGNSAAMLVFGATLAATSLLVVPILAKRATKQQAVMFGCGLMTVSIIAFALAPTVTLAFVCIVPMAAAFAIGYPNFLGLFSASVGPDKQGWVMGVSVAFFTLPAGITSAISGRIIALNLDAPFYMGAATTVLALILVLVLWRTQDVRAIATVSD
ncbi:MAG: MFS transporter [Pseudomonadota bacterium]